MILGYNGDLNINPYWQPLRYFRTIYGHSITVTGPAWRGHMPCFWEMESLRKIDAATSK